MSHARQVTVRIVTQSLHLAQVPPQKAPVRSNLIPKARHRYGARLHATIASILLISIGAVMLYQQIEHALDDVLPSLLATLMIGLALSSFVYRPDGQHP